MSYSAIVPMTLPVWVANDEGMFKQNGLDVQLTYIESSKGIPAVISGETQVANIGGPETLSAVAGGADLITVACESPTWPFVMQVVPGINSMQDLKGKKIGVSNFGSTSDIATRIALQHENLDPNKDVAIIAVGSASNRLAALKSGAIQGGMSYPPDSYTLEAQGFKTIFDLGAQHPAGSTATDIMQRSWLNANRPVAQKYVDSLVQAIASIKKNKTAAAQVLGKYMKSDDQAALGKTVDYFVQNVFPALPDAKPDQYTDAQQILGASNTPVKSYNVSTMLDDSLVQNAGSRGLDKQ
ncbi:MAG TPA: ABC transporter substrate-binding protein [Chloroflexota bacterium]|nr:ABC transporter substrate-binding protein [Chloroflexota bacterium]